MQSRSTEVATFWVVIVLGALLLFSNPVILVLASVVTIVLSLALSSDLRPLRRLAIAYLAFVAVLYLEVAMLGFKEHMGVAERLALFVLISPYIPYGGYAYAILNGPDSLLAPTASGLAADGNHYVASALVAAISAGALFLTLIMAGNLSVAYVRAAYLVWGAITVMLTVQCVFLVVFAIHMSEGPTSVLPRLAFMFTLLVALFVAFGPRAQTA